MPDNEPITLEIHDATVGVVIDIEQPKPEPDPDSEEENA